MGLEGTRNNGKNDTTTESFAFNARSPLSLWNDLQRGLRLGQLPAFGDSHVEENFRMCVRLFLRTFINTCVLYSQIC